MLFGKDRLPEAGRASTDPAADLRQALNDLETDLAETEKQVAAAVAEAGASHSRAMAFVQAGNDADARLALVEKSAAEELRNRLDAEAAVLRSMIAECRAVLETSPPQG
jgi:phage shock protein A